MLLKPSYIIHKNKLTVYRSRFLVISYTIGGTLGCIGLFIMPFVSEIWEVDIYTVVIYLLIIIIITHCFKYLFDNDVKFEITNEGIYIKNRYLKWVDVSKFHWNYLGGAKGLDYLNIYIEENNDLAQPIKFKYEIDFFLMNKFEKKIFDPFVSEILKNYPNIQFGQVYVDLN